MEANALTHQKMRAIDFLIFIIGTALYAWGLVNINIPNHLAEGGITGVTLITRALFGINPAYMNIILNVPLVLAGFKMLARRDIVYMFFGIASLSFWLWLWQRMPVQFDLNHDMLISALLAGAFSGIGSGLVYRFGGTTGGTDIIARIFEQRWQVPMGRTMFILDAVVLTASLVYINVPEMVYTLIASFVFARIVNLTQQGGYSARAFMIFTTHDAEISQAIMNELERGTTLLHAEGGYSHEFRRVLYTVVDPTEVQKVRAIVSEIDPRAFVTMVETTETLGEGFSFMRRKKRLFGLK
ncbi:YitT family protein [Weissella diestrammenae]|uniref:YitT family protein n=1 Tax=Weissella diestrammenae TaxID=1162633 RepID=A0A7G9T7P1_9LACO|nr:YitT family protein [Weissella diestrammenae]MCM0582074.1 YitT family protein [Weissella diestrammenae]QNN76116.1 YitT family protein [Weissella diestrammenae]